MKNDQTVDRFAVFRRIVLKGIDPQCQPIPAVPTVAFVWPTESCSIGCAHCSYSSKKKGPPSLLLSHIDRLVEWLAEAGVMRFVACGGGEPLDEPELIERAIELCAHNGLDFEIYTSGVSRLFPQAPRSYIKRWKAAWTQKIGQKQQFSVRLSCDAFHEEIIGVAPLAEWVNELKILAPDWPVSIRGLNVANDQSIQHLAEQLNGHLSMQNQTSGVISSENCSVPVRLKGYVLEGRGSLRQLDRLSLGLPDNHALRLKPSELDRSSPLEVGRPFSLRFAMSRRRVDLEIHSDCVVHMLQSQSPDLRMSFTNHSWNDIRDAYYRDPLLHTTIDGGLEAIAQILIDLQRSGHAPQSMPLYSIEKMTHPVTLAFATAKAVLLEPDGFYYNETTKELCKQFLDEANFT